MEPTAVRCRLRASFRYCFISGGYRRQGRPHGPSTLHGVPVGVTSSVPPPEVSQRTSAEILCVMVAVRACRGGATPCVCASCIPRASVSLFFSRSSVAVSRPLSPRLGWPPYLACGIYGPRGAAPCYAVNASEYPHLSSTLPSSAPFPSFFRPRHAESKERSSGCTLAASKGGGGEGYGARRHLGGQVRELSNRSQSTTGEFERRHGGGFIGTSS